MSRVRQALVTLMVAAAISVSCAGSSGAAATAEKNDSSSRSRDWHAHPAIVEVDQTYEIYAVSDPHGEYATFVKLLTGNHLIDASADPTKVRWTGGAAILVVVGDLIDKGPESLQVIDLVRTLQESARSSGGRVIATMGNHEAEFLHDPKNDKATSTGQDATGIDQELAAAHIDPKTLVQGTDPDGRGTWLANLPFGVRVKKWFFCHAGNTHKLSIKVLENKLEDSLDHDGFGGKDITGSDSILEAQGWYGNPDDGNAGQKEADALGVDHIVFGHDPGAFGAHGVKATKNGVLVKIDTAMGLHDSGDVGKAYLLHIKTHGKDSAEVLDDKGDAKQLL